MLRNIALCAACLAARGFAPGYSFAMPPQTMARRVPFRCKISFVGVAHQTLSASQQQQQRQQSSVSVFPAASPLRCRGGDEEEAGSAVPEDLPSPVDADVVPVMEALAASEAGSDQDPIIEALSAPKTFVTGAILACLMFVSSTLNVETIPPVHAVAQQQQQQQRLEVVAPQPPRKVHPPPPEIPAGRITIVQWCDRNIGRYLPKLDVQAAAETAEKIRINSGPAPTVEDLRSMVGDAAKREWDGLLGGDLAGRGKRMVDRSGSFASPEVRYRVLAGFGVTFTPVQSNSSTFCMPKSGRFYTNRKTSAVSTTD